MTLYTWRASSRGWREPNWRIALFWAPLILLAGGVIFLIAWQFAPLPRIVAFIVGVPLGVGAIQGGAWLAGATRKPDLADSIEAGEKPDLADVLIALAFLPEPPPGPPARRRPCWKCRSYRRRRQHYTCHNAVNPVTVEYGWLPEGEGTQRQLHDRQHQTNVRECPYCTEEQNRRGA